MSRKDYIIIAGAIYETRKGMLRRCQPEMDKLVIALADVLKEDNPEFDREKFYKAAGQYEVFRDRT